MESLFGEISNIISLAITPAFLLLGVLTQIRVLNYRHARVVDRCEVLETRLEARPEMRPETSPEKRSEARRESRPEASDRFKAAAEHELSVLYRRMGAIHRAIGFAIGCVALICSVVVVLFVDDLLDLRLGSLIAFMFVMAMLLMIASFSLFLHEIFVASHSLPATALHRAGRNRAIR